MSRLIRLALALFVALASAVSLSAQQVYVGTGSGGAAGTLYKFDVSTGQQLSSVPITNNSGGGAIGVTGLAFNPLDGLLYGVSVNKAVAGGNTLSAPSLLQINPTTGTATVLGALRIGTTNAPVGDISFAPNGALYGWESQSPATLAQITLSGPNAGQLTTIGNAGTLTTGGGLALSPFNSNTFYVSATGADPTFSTLDTVDRTTGARTVGPLIGNGGANPPPKHFAMGALAFFGNTLYASNSSGDSTEVNGANQPDEVHLVTINLVNGAITDLFRFPFYNVDAIAFAPIPEPSTLGLLALGGVGAVGLCVYRRRR